MPCLDPLFLSRSDDWVAMLVCAGADPSSADSRPDRSMSVIDPVNTSIQVRTYMYISTIR